MASSPSFSKPGPRRGRPRTSDWRLFMQLVPYARRSGALLLGSMILLVPLSIANAIQPLIIGQAISFIRQEPTWGILQDKSLVEGINILVAVLVFTLLIRMVMRAGEGYLVQRMGQQITADMRNDLFDHVTSLASQFFDRTPVGSLITRLTNDVEALGDVFATGAIGILSDLLAIVVLAIAMFSLEWRLALMLVSMLLPVTGLIIYFQYQYRKANYRAREELSALNSTLQENLLGIGVVQLFRREQFNAEQFYRTNRRYNRQINKTIFHDSAVSATLEWIALVAIAGVLILGGSLIMDNSLTFGILASFILFAQRLFDPLRQFADKFTTLQSGFTAVERISDILSQPIDIRDPETPKSLPSAPSAALTVSISHPQDRLNPQAKPSQQNLGEIRFEDVWFGYKPDEYVLQNLTFTIRPGEKIALVGPTGAGKSSIIRLLCRLYETSQGRILIDGVDVRDITQAELRRHMGVILQDGFLFAGDVKSNITLGETYSLEQVRAAAERTNVATFIEQLPQGYDTPLRERGTNLSAGQKQLLAFARAAIRNPQVLVLDEATASLDVGTEALVQEALDRLLEGRTAIIIAHRLSTIRNVDRILVLKRGQLIESGSHDELLQVGGLYYSLYKLQLLGTRS